jgi:hypothetical protein
VTKRQPQQPADPTTRIWRAVDELDDAFHALDDAPEGLRALAPYLNPDKLESVIAALAIVAEVHEQHRVRSNEQDE